MEEEFCNEPRFESHYSNYTDKNYKHTQQKIINGVVYQKN